MNEDIEFHSHLRRRMAERGITREEVRHTLAHGWPCSDAKPGTEGRTCVFDGPYEHAGQRFAEKEVTVYFRNAPNVERIVLTAKARYGRGFRLEAKV